MNILTFDNETTTSNKGNAFDQTNFMCTSGILRHIDDIELDYKYFDFMNDPTTENLRKIQRAIDWADLIIGFNLKFDMHWYSRYGISFAGKRLYDVQLAEFLISNQKNAFPSLDDTGEKYGKGRKLDVIKTEYWERGIDTPDVPLYVLLPYMEQDVRLTYECYKHQCFLLQGSPLKQRLLSLQNQDLGILQEMEFNGLRFNFEKSKELGDDVQHTITEMDNTLNNIAGGVPINFGSGDHMSAWLYGGIIRESYQEPIGHYKTGARAGEVKLGWKERIHVMPQLVAPPDRSEGKETKDLSDEDVLAKKGYRVYATNEGVLKSLKTKGTASTIIKTILQRSKLEKLRGTYYHGLPELSKTLNWKPEYMHGQFNQVVAITGRLSSSKPNLQNMPPDMDALFLSRFNNEHI